MAVTPRDPDDAFLREVDEGVRRDQMASLWQRYGRGGIVALVLFLAALGGWLLWQDRLAKQAGIAGEDFTQALSKLDVGDTTAARPVLDRLSRDGPAGYRPLAMMMQASDAIGSGNEPRAIKLYETVAADAAAPQPLRDAATIKAVRLSYDSLPPATVIARLKDFVTPGNPWFAIAGEMTALAHLKAGEVAAAKPLLIAIVRDADNPPSLRGRAAQLALSIGVDGDTLQLPRRTAGAADGAAAPPGPPSPVPAPPAAAASTPAASVPPAPAK